MKKIEIFSYVIVLLLIGTGTTWAAALKDPALRDEDISKTDLSVEIFTRPDGLNEFVYTLDSPIENLGRIVRLEIDISCEVVFDPVVLPFPIGAEGYDDSHDEDGVPPHTPTAVIGDWGSSWSYGFDYDGNAQWGVWLAPGESTNGLRMVSPAEE